MRLKKVLDPSRLGGARACLLGLVLAACGPSDPPQASPAKSYISATLIGLPLVDGVQTYSGEWKLIGDGAALPGAYVAVASARGRQISWAEAGRMEKSGDATVEAYLVAVSCMDGAYKISVSGSARVLFDPLSLKVDGLLGAPMLASNEDSTAEVSRHDLTGEVGTAMFRIVAETVDAMAKSDAIEFFPIKIRYSDTAALEKVMIACERAYDPRYR